LSFGETESPASESAIEALLVGAADPLASPSNVVRALRLATDGNLVKTPADACLAAMGRLLSSVVQGRVRAATHPADPVMELITKLGIETLAKDRDRQGVLAEAVEAAVMRLWPVPSSVTARRRLLRQLADRMNLGPCPSRGPLEAGSGLRSLRRPITFASNAAKTEMGA